MADILKKQLDVLIGENFKSNSVLNFEALDEISNCVDELYRIMDDLEFFESRKQLQLPS
jgi:hypothetical protein